MSNIGMIDSGKQKGAWIAVAVAFGLMLTMVAISLGYAVSAHNRAQEANQKASFVRSAYMNKLAAPSADGEIGTCSDPVIERINDTDSPCASFYEDGDLDYTLIVESEEVIIINTEPFNKTQFKAFRNQIESLDHSYKDKTISLVPVGFTVGSLEVTKYSAWDR